LADLCDADVLVHVVDATGRSDRDGNALGGGESGGDQDLDPGAVPRLFCLCLCLSICSYVKTSAFASLLCPVPPCYSILTFSLF
jgi:hypothetical protein